tara:strand:- start:938 stop:1102 length:165 start_codon:yes stop_codon:yes gene_type:complete
VKGGFFGLQSKKEKGKRKKYTSGRERDNVKCGQPNKISTDREIYVEIYIMKYIL